MHKRQYSEVKNKTYLLRYFFGKRFLLPPRERAHAFAHVCCHYQAPQTLLQPSLDSPPDSRPCPDSLTSRARYRQTLRLVPQTWIPPLRFFPKLPSHESLGNFWSLDLRCGGSWVGGGSRVRSGWARCRGRLSLSSSSSPSSFYLQNVLRVQVTLTASSSYRVRKCWDRSQLHTFYVLRTFVPSYDTSMIRFIPGRAVSYQAIDMTCILRIDHQLFTIRLQQQFFFCVHFL